MASDAAEQPHGEDAELLSLTSSSTKRRIAELNSLAEKIRKSEINVDQLSLYLRFLFSTHPYYGDRPSRKAVRLCLQSLYESESLREPTLKRIINAIKIESTKAGISATNAFVLLEWVGDIFSQVSGNVEEFNAYVGDVVMVQVNLLEICLGSLHARHAVKDQALVVTRRALRNALKTDHYETVIKSIVQKLTVKGTASTSKNAYLLGILAGVASRLPKPKEVLESLKKDVYAFYVREIIGSKVPVSSAVANSLGDFFSAFTTAEDFSAELSTPFERALLRSPEVVLSDVLTSLIGSLSKSIDLSVPYKEKLLKQLLACLKSTNADIRKNAVYAFSAAVPRFQTEAAIDSMVDEILNPLKTGKVTVAEQRVLHAQMLSAITGSKTLAQKIPLGLAAVIVKEPNEAAIGALSAALVKHLVTGLHEGIAPEKTVVDAIQKAIADKRPTVKRLWVLRVGDIIWDIDPNSEAASSDTTQAFFASLLPGLLEIWNEVTANPLPATQSGLITAAYVISALNISKFANWINPTVVDTLKKADTVARCLVTQPKTSFLINVKVYSKLTLEEDLKWNIRSLAAIAAHLDNGKPHADDWASAFLYSICAHNTTHELQKTATTALSTVYLARPEAIGKIILNGTWQWLRALEQSHRDTAASASKTGGKYLPLAIDAISLPMPEQEELVKQQLVNLAVVSHHELMDLESKGGWIGICQRAKIDPGNLVKERAPRFTQEIQFYTATSGKSAYIRNAAIKTCATLAFVAAESITPLFVKMFQGDLDANLLNGIGETEIKIWKTPEGELYLDPLSTNKGQPQILKSNAKDYDTLKWEAELRAQLEKKKGLTQKKLTSEEQAKVNEQLAKESAIRVKVEDVGQKLRRGVGVIKSLAEGNLTGVEIWMTPALKSLLGVLTAGGGMLVGAEGVKAYLACAEHVSHRLGALRKFVGVAVLRGLEVSDVPEHLQQEPLASLTTRLLYRLRLSAEQRPFDTTSLSFLLTFALLVLKKGGLGTENQEDADEQLVLALEFLSFHTEACADRTIDRGEILQTLIYSMQKYSHYKIIKDCLSDLCRCISDSISREELEILIKGVVTPEVSVRTAILQAIEAEIFLEDLTYSDEIWLACHDEVDENVELAQTIWQANELHTDEETPSRLLPFLEKQDRQLRGAAARALAEAVKLSPQTFSSILNALKSLYREKAKPIVPQYDEFGMLKKIDMRDPWEARSGVALALKELSSIFAADELVGFAEFLIKDKALGEKVGNVREEIIDAATAVIKKHGKAKLEELMKVFEQSLESGDDGTDVTDRINEAVIILYGAMGQHLKAGDKRIPGVVNKLLQTLSTPSEAVQYAVAECLPPLIKTSQDKTSEYIQEMLDQLSQGKGFAKRRGAAYGLAGIVKGKGIGALKEYRIMSTLKASIDNKKEAHARQGALFAYELLSLILGKLFEPYVIQILPLLLQSFGDTVVDVREACGDAAKVCFSNLSSYGVKVILPILLDGLDEQQWRSKKGACDMLGNMAYLSPHQLAISLPEIIPPLTNVLNDSHKEVRLAANRALHKFGEVINNPEIKLLVGILLKALSDPTKYTDDALDALMKVQFVHYLDSPSLALVSRILERGLSDRSATKKKASQIIGSLAHLTEKKDLMVHIPVLVAGLKQAIVDPVPATRSTASKALGTLVEKLGEESLPDIIPGLMNTLKSDTGAGDRLGSAQALSEVLAGLGTQRFEETLPSILQNATSAKPSVREGFMSLFIYLPACFGNSFSVYLNRIIPPILSGLADDVESIRDVSLRAGRLLVKNFATRAIDLLLPELERGLADVSHRIRLSSVELVGDLLFNLTGISGKTDAEDDEASGEVSQSLLDVLGQERRDKVLSALYICRCDTSGQVRLAAVNVWKALVSSPRTLKDLIPTLTQLIIRRLASSNIEQRAIAGQALGELIRKAGEGVMSTLLPTLEEGLQTSTDKDSKQGICVALRELIASTPPEALEDYEKTLVSVVRTALVDSDDDVRETAAEAFDALQKVIGKRAVDQVLPYLLNLLRSPDDAENALAALLTLLTENTRANIILPNLIPTLLSPPVTSFNARALASLSRVAGSAMNRRLPNILNSLMDSIIGCTDADLLADLEASFDAVLQSVDEFDGLNTAMAHMLTLIKHDDHHRRAVSCKHMAAFFEESELDYSRYTQDFIRVLLVLFSDSDPNVVKNAWSALNELTKKLKKEEMEALVFSTRQVLQSVGVAGHNLPGFALPKGINAILPIFLQGLMYGTTEQRTQSALAISDIVDRTSGESLRPFVTQITGPLIRVVSERSVDVKAAILLTLNSLLQKIPTYLKPFLPQLQRTFAKSLADTSSDLLRSRAAKALGTLITLTPRIDPLISELVTGARTPDSGVKSAMLKALYEVVSKAGGNMGDASKSAIISLVDEDLEEEDDEMIIAGARLLGALVSHLSPEEASRTLKTRTLNPSFTKASILALNATLVESPKSLVELFAEETPNYIAQGIKHKSPFVSDNSVLAAGKYLISEDIPNKNFEVVKVIVEAIAGAIKAPVSGSVDTKRLALVVVRTVSRMHFELIRPHLQLLAPIVFSMVRDMVIPVKLAAEQAFLALFQVVENGDTLFEKYIPTVEGPQKRSMQEYYRRIATKLAAAHKDRADAGGAAVGLSSDEDDDYKEIMSVGKGEVEEWSTE
ncbi:armadillo-type protein [Peziza echinospora]|nr:armadillo-type protein [Peziza echinospora]